MSNNGQSKKRVLGFVRRDIWIFVVGAATILAAAMAFPPYFLQKWALDLELSRIPKLEYSYTLLISDPNLPMLLQARNRLVDRYYGLLYAKAQANPGMGYQYASDRALPLQETVSPQPISLLVTIRNNGGGAAKKVRAKIVINRLISSLKIDTLEPTHIIEGGVGQKTTTIEIDRVVSGVPAAITIGSDALPPGTQSDKLVLQKAEAGMLALPSAQVYEPGSDNAAPVLLNGGFPTLNYVIASRPDVSVEVTFDQGRATIVPTATPIPSPTSYVLPPATGP
jgi:hypothetical protein